MKTTKLLFFFLFSPILMYAYDNSVVSVKSISNQSDKKPNIIMIMADDMGYECLSANGSTSYKTPTLDKMASEGVRFTHCYAQPLCTPTRVKIMTGLYNMRNYVKFGVLDRKESTFAHLVKKQGYATCIVGKWQLGSEPDFAQHFGFDESCLWQHTRPRTRKAQGDFVDTRFTNPRLEINGEEKDYDNGEFGPDVVSDYACDFIRKNKDKPFMVYYPMLLTHCPFVPTPGTKDYDPKDPGSPSYKGDQKYFGDMVSHTDKIVQKIWDTVKEIKQEENTLIIFTGDNGTDKPVVSMMGKKKIYGQKGSMTDYGTRVPLVVYWKGTIKSGLVTDTLVDFSDMLPTICDVTGTTMPDNIPFDGQSFLPQLKGDNSNERQYIQIWYSRSGKKNKAQQFTRNQKYKLYGTGKFFDIESEPSEKKPIKAPSDKEKKIKDMLQKALDKYKDL